jgi:hypothetical protein
MMEGKESRVPKKAKSRSELTFWELLYLHEECGSSCETKAALVIDAVRRARACGFTGNHSITDGLGRHAGQLAAARNITPYS